MTGGVILATKIPLGQVGGLAAYAHALAAGLGERGFSGRFVGVVGPRSRPGHLPSGWTVEEWKTRRRMQPLWSGLASRPALHGVAEPLARWMHPPGGPVSSVGPVVHWIGTGWDGMGYSLKAMARRRGAKFTVLPAVHPESWGDDRIDIRLYETADAVLCLSDHEAAHLASRGVPEDRLVVTGLPPLCQADGNAQQFRRLHGLGERPTVLFLGRRDSGKGYPALLAAWARVVAVVPDAVLVLGGPGGEEFREARHRLPTGTVVDLGVPDEGEKADALAGCDVFCLPSAHESFGIVYVEAWSYGKPVICGTAPASRELVPAGVAGLHASQDPEELSASLLRLLQNRAEATALGAAGKRLQEERYTVKRMVDDHLRAWGGI